MLDTSVLADLTPEEEATVEQLRRLAQEPHRTEASRLQQAFIDARCKEAKVGDPAKAASLGDGLRALLEGRTAVLPPDLVIQVECLERRNTFQPVAVRDTLGDVARYDGRRTRDPIEPGYGGGRAVGKLFLSGKVPRLKSFAHGGTDYQLRVERPVVRTGQALRAHAVEAVLEIERQAVVYMDYGSQLVTVENGRMIELNDLSLGHALAQRIDFVEVAEHPDAEDEPVDPPLMVLRTILALKERRGLRPLQAVQSSPFLRPDGAVVQAPGYDAETGIFAAFHAEDFARVPDAPSREEATGALKLIEAILEDFRFETGRDRTAGLVGVLTAATRGSMDKAPMLAVQSHSVGSGKTSLASGYAALALGRPAGLEDASKLSDNAEMRKAITAHLLKPDCGVFFLDNADGPQASAPLGALLTSARWSDRRLGASVKEVDLPTRTLVLLTGTGLMFQDDLARRAVRCCLGPISADAKPIEDFEAVVLRRRPEIVVAVLTLIRAALTSGAPRAPGEVRSFAAWDRLVRQTVAWVGTHLAPGAYEDPRELILDQTAHAMNRVELLDVFVALKSVYGDEPFAASDVASAMELDMPIRERKILAGFFGEKEKPSAKSVGRYLTSKVGIQVEGLALRAHRHRGMSAYTMDGELPEGWDGPKPA